MRQAAQENALDLGLGCTRPTTLGDALALHRHLNDGQAFRWARKNPGLFRLIHVNDALVA